LVVARFAPYEDAQEAGAVRCADGWEIVSHEGDCPRTLRIPAENQQRDVFSPGNADKKGFAGGARD
jgi:hypothetical protein